MQTLKIRYIVSDEDKSLIKEYQRQYSNVLHCAYNRVIEGKTEKEITDIIYRLNNLDLMDSYFVRSAVKESVQLFKTRKDKIIFGGKKNFIERCQGKITKEDFKIKRLSPIYSIGEANRKANRKFEINQECNSFLFKPCRKTHIELTIDGGYRKFKKILNKLYSLQETKSTAISYKLDSQYIYVSFDECAIQQFKPHQIENRVFSIDLNPNYIGWSVVDWKSSSEFNLIKSGVISIKKLNDKEFVLKKTKNNPNGLPSEHPKRIYLNNKRNFEVLEIGKNLISKALHYKCSIFSIEDLKMESKDKKKGSHFNSLCNNMWNRVKLVNNLQKRCNMFNIKLLKVMPNYSSFIGNFLFRSLNLPDMVLAAIEIGRRAYEFNLQYIKKISDIKNNIIKPRIIDFYDRYVKSLEEFGVDGEFNDLVKLYYFLKKSKCRYRLSLEEINPKFSRCFSTKSLITKMI